MDLKSLIPVVWSNQRVLTTAQLAEFYGTSPDNIKKNFNANKDRFIEGKHYFKLEGTDLVIFKDWVTDSYAVQNESYAVQKNTRVLYLWTERGAARHAKMLSNDKAWEVFEELEDNYFNQNPVVETAPVVKPAAEKIDLARVYLILLSDGTIKIVKIGQSKNIRSRVAKIERETGLKVVNIHYTPPLLRETARLVEWTAQKKLSAWHVKGEFFSANFDEARKVIDISVELATAELPSNYFGRGENILNIADK